jgi:DNA-binding Lrp family transcriptional regulator
MRNVSNKKVKGNVQYSNDRFDNNSDELKPFLKKDNSLREKGLIASSYKKNIRKKQNGIATTIRGNETDSTQETVLKKDKDSGYGQNTSRNSNVAALNLDKINLKIIDELLSNADITSADIAKKIKIPLSTVQRRRRNLERMSVIKKNYELDLGIFGVRIAEISLEIKNGETQRVVSQLKSQKENQIVNTFLRVGDPQINASVVVVYKTSEQLFTIIESMKKNPNISRVSWSEYISKERNTQQIITTLLEETSKD